MLKGQSQLSISFGVEIAKLLALVQNYLVSNQNIGSYRIVPKINFVFYRKGSTEPISLNHYGRSCDVTRFMWCVFLGYFFIPQD